MKYSPDYQPHGEASRNIDQFEELIGMPLRKWLMQHRQQGYSERWMSEKIGVSPHVVRRLLEAWQIPALPPEQRLRFHRVSSDRGYAVQARMRMDGCYTRKLYDRVLRRLDKGMPYPVALEKALAVKPRRTKNERAV